MNDADIRKVLAIFQERPIAFYPAFARICSDVKAGLMLSQLFYWSPRGTKHADGWVEKTHAEWEAETCLSRREIEHARGVLMKAGLIDYKRVGVPARPVYLLNFSRLAEMCKQDCTKAPNKSVRLQGNLDCTKAPIYHTETTSETTSENTASATRTVAPPETAPTFSAIPDSVRTQKAPPRRKPSYFDWQVVKVYLDATGRKWIAKADAEFLNENVSDSLKFAGVVAEWIARGYNPTNYAGLVDVYYNGWRPTPTRKPEQAQQVDKFAVALEMIRARSEAKP